MEYYSEAETQAVREMSERGGWKHYEPADILRPDLIPTFEAPSMKLLKYRAMVRNYESFVVLGQFDDADKPRRMEHHDLKYEARKLGLVATSGTARFNHYDGHRKSSEFSTLKVSSEAGIYAVLWSCIETNPTTDINGIKIGMIRNPGSVNPFATRTFVETLKQIALNLQTDVMWGNTLEVNDPAFPTNALQDKRFQAAEIRTFQASDQGKVDLEVSRLAKFWELMGLPVMISPDSGGIANGIFSANWQSSVLAA